MPTHADDIDIILTPLVQSNTTLLMWTRLWMRRMYTLWTFGDILWINSLSILKINRRITLAILHVKVFATKIIHKIFGSILVVNISVCERTKTCIMSLTWFSVLTSSSSAGSVMSFGRGRFFLMREVTDVGDEDDHF